MTNGWVRVAGVDELDEEGVLQVRAGDKPVALYQINGRYYATSDICTHEYACLSEGFVVDGKIECPLHQGLFDIATGKAQGPPVEVDLETFQTRIENDEIFVLI